LDSLIDIDEAVRRIEEAPHLLDIAAYKFLFPDSQIIKERFALLTKSIIAYRE